MRALISFTKKEFKSQIRSAKFNILIGLFIFFGILNPLFAKLIPFLFETLEDAMAQAGMNMPITPASDLDSWAQFYGNFSLYMIIFIIMQGNIFTKEYGNNTLVLVLTKGLDRWKVLCSKAFMLCALWTFYYLIYFLATYAATEYFFNTSIAQNVVVSAVYLWIGGLWICALAIFFSTLGKSIGTGIAGTRIPYILMSIFSVIPSIDKYLPTSLMSGANLIYGTSSPSDYLIALGITVVTAAALITASVPMFNKKQI